MPVTVVPYDPSWPKNFVDIRNRLEGVLQDVPYLSIEHVGSTSVPGLAAKPIIDIDIIVKGEDIERAKNALTQIGKCDYMGELGISDRHAFQDPNQDTPYNLYVCIDGCASLRNHLVLRDTLRTRADLRDEYASVKVALASKSTNIIDYIAAKSSTIQKILATSNAFSSTELEAISSNNSPDSALSPFRTSRLLLREFTSTDIESYFKLEGNEENARYQNWAPRTLSESRNLVLENIRSTHAVPRTTWELAVEEHQNQNSGPFIGRVGAHTRPARVVDCLPGEDRLKHIIHVDLWFSFLPTVHGRGFATEATVALIEILTRKLLGDGKLEFEIECDPRNVASWKVAEKLGFERFELVKGAWECKGEWVDSLVYRKVIGDG